MVSSPISANRLHRPSMKENISAVRMDGVSVHIQPHRPFFQCFHNVLSIVPSAGLLRLPLHTVMGHKALIFFRRQGQNTTVLFQRLSQIVFLRRKHAEIS